MTLLILLFILIITGCSTTPDISSKPVTPSLVTSHLPIEHKQHHHEYWWSARFRMVLDLEKGPNYAMDLLLADQIITPILKKHTSITLWRVHRRAVPDAAGHQFSFIFYTTPELAQQVFEDIAQTPLLTSLTSANLLKEVLIENTQFPKQPMIGDTADQRWPAKFNQAWPSFIMGVSASWLNMIEQYKPKDTNAQMEVQALLERYKTTELTLIEIWQQNAQHAFLHHLSAVFGYHSIPLDIQF